MAHTLRLDAIVNLPVTVIYRTTPCTWKLERDPRETIWRDGKFVHPIRFFEGDPRSVLSKQFDAWTVRQRFLELRSERDFLDFLAELGHFSASLAKGKRGTWGMDAFRCWQQVFRQFLKRSPEKWEDYVQTLIVPGFDTRRIIQALNEASKFRIHFRWRKSKHAAALMANDVVAAIFATIHIDRLQGSKYGFCARPDCQKPFKIKSGHRRIYCKMYCAHLQGVRRLRAKQKKLRPNPSRSRRP